MNLRSTQWPTFLGIGVPKAGSTWLYETLCTHPQIWLPPDEREVHFFNRYYEDRGLCWYAQFFPKSEAASYTVGEITPSYIYCGPEQIEAIKSTMPTVTRLILILRNPVDRLYSAYWNRRRLYNFNVSFRTFIEESVEGAEKNIKHGRYAEYLRRWFRYFEITQFSILTVESDLTDPELARKKIADFLEVDPDAYPPDAGKKKRNPRHLPYFRSAYAWAVEMNKKLKRNNIYWPSRVARKISIKDWFGKKDVNDEMNPRLRNRLLDLYADDVRDLEDLLDREFTECDIST
jgi:hypothetical protein